MSFSPNRVGVCSIYDLVEAVLRFFLHRITNLSNKLTRVLRFMRTDMIDVEHRAGNFISVLGEDILEHHVLESGVSLTANVTVLAAPKTAAPLPVIEA